MASRMEAIEVDVPVRTAYDQWTQFEDLPRFMEGGRDLRRLDDTHLRWTARVAGDTKEQRARGDLERFKAFIEERAGETGAWRGEVQQDPTT